MKRRTNTATYKFLHENGYLGFGEEKLREGLKAYKKQYHKAYKANYRAKKKEYSITCDPKADRVLRDFAKRHNMKIAEYVRMAALAYCARTYIVPRLQVVFDVRQLLMLLRTDVQRIAAQKRGLFQRDKSEQVEAALNAISAEITRALLHPETLEDAARNAAAESAQFRMFIKSLIADDSEVKGL